jgi:hypothetical protein
VPVVVTALENEKKKRKKKAKKRAAEDDELYDDVNLNVLASPLIPTGVVRQR